MALSRSLFWGVRSLGAEGSPRRRSIDLYCNDGMVTRLCMDEGTFHLSFISTIKFCSALQHWWRVSSPFGCIWGLKLEVYDPHTAINRLDGSTSSSGLGLAGLWKACF